MMMIQIDQHTTHQAAATAAAQKRRNILMDFFLQIARDSNHVRQQQNDTQHVVVFCRGFFSVAHFKFIHID